METNYPPPAKNHVVAIDPNLRRMVERFRKNHSYTVKVAVQKLLVAGEKAIREAAK